MSGAIGIDYFNRGHWLSKIQAKQSIKARRKLFNLFLSFANSISGKSVLDVGGTPDTERLDSNCMIPWIGENGGQAYMYSPEDIKHLSNHFSGIKILSEKDWKTTPNTKFDWVICSAVLEHVGSFQSQVDFLKTLGFKSNNIFLTTPNRFHWLEFHTKLPLLHWLPKNIHRSVLKCLGHKDWINESHLNLVSKSELYQIAKAAFPNAQLTVSSVWALGMPSNLFLVVKTENK